jgi:dihydrofolate reductase
MIAAVGRSGQIGLGEKLPWTKDAEDLAFFELATRKNIVVLGSRTFDTLFECQPVWNDRMVLRMSRHNTQIYEGKLLGYFEPGVQRIIQEFADKPLDLFVAGGSCTFKVWRQHIRRSFITHVDYNGKADRWMSNLWVRT